MSLKQRLEYQERASKGVWCPVRMIDGEVAISSTNGQKFKDRFRAIQKRELKKARAKKAEDLPDDAQEYILRESTFKGIAHAWRAKDESGEWVDSIEGPDGDRLEFNRENWDYVCSEVWGFLQEVIDYATMEATFEEEFLEEIEGN